MSCSEENESRISSLWPETYAVTPTGRAVACRMLCSVTTPVPRSAPATSAEMIATRSWPMRRISAGPLASAHVGDGRERHRPLAARIHDQAADLFDRRRARVDAAHEHVDLLVVQPVARRDFAAHALHDAVGDVANCEAELRRALLIEHDLDLGIAGLDGRAHVAEQWRREHARVHALSCLAQALEVVAGNHDFERRRKREQARTAELMLHAGHLLQGVAQLRDRAFLVLARCAVTERDADATGVLAGIDGIRVEAVAGAGDGV